MAPRRLSTVPPRVLKSVGRLLLEMDGHASDGFFRQPRDEVVRVPREDGPILLDGRRVELVVRHFAASAPVLAVIHGSEAPSEAGTIDKTSAGTDTKIRSRRTDSSFNMIIRGLALTHG